MVKPIFLGLSAGLSMFALVESANAAPASVKLSWASEDAATTMAVSWVTSAQADTVIEWGVQSTAEHSLTGLPATELAGIGWIHEIELTNLTPNTRYKYRVGAAGDFSPEYTFKTAPNDGCTPFTFVQLGDARSQDSRGPSRNWAGIHEEAMQAGADFILNGGDLVREGTDIGQWATWLSDSAMVNPVVPMMPAIGNHDDGPGDGNSANYNRLFVLPRNSVTGTEDYYAFVYNNVLVFSLSTQTFEDWAAQAQWMSQIAAQHPTKWKVVFFHHPVYTTQTTLLIDVGHPPNEQGQNPTWGPAFDAAGIDVVFQSHNHIYERFSPLRYDTNDPEQGTIVADYGNGPGQGRLYVVSGGSGAFLDPLIERVSNTANGSAVRSADHHFMKIAITGNTLQYSAVRTHTGNTSGGGTLIDQITLTRPGPDPCAQPMDPDMDHDGYPASRDCNDGDPTINPGVVELCGNAIDEDCSGRADACPPPPTDEDHDGSPAESDCDDHDATRSPLVAEVECDGIDNDCDCFEDCRGARTDLCAAPDAGMVADAAAAQPDASASVMDAEPTIVDAATATDAGAVVDATTGALPAASSCGCATVTRECPDGHFPFGHVAAVGLVVWMGRRRARGRRRPQTTVT